MTKPAKKVASISQITIVGEGFDESGRRYILFAVGDKDDLPPFPVDEISDKSSFFGKLNQHGANIFTQRSRNELLKRLEEFKSDAPSFKVVTRVGWAGSRFVLPDMTFGKGKLPLKNVFDGLDPQMISKYRVKGTLADWQSKIGSVCPGNSRLMFAASLGVTGPMLRFAGEPRSGGLQLVGIGETGKSTAAMVTGSIWGCHRVGKRRETGFSESWHTTGGESGGKVEITALAHNDTALILDETTRTPPKTVLDAAFGLAEGIEKERLGTGRSARSWRCFFLSTSNVTLDQMAEAAKIAMDEARKGRFVDVPLPAGGHGLYEDLHGFADGEILTNRLKRRCRTYFGAPGREFICKLVEEFENDREGLTKFLRAERKAYLDAIESKAQKGGLKPLNRASGRFATIFAAGSLAIRYKVFLWDREELLAAILSCQVDGLTMPTSDPKLAPAVPLKSQLIAWLQQHQHEFMDLDKKRPKKGAHEFGSVPGYMATFKGQKWFYLKADQLHEIICGGTEADQLKKGLVASKLLEKAGGRYVVQRPVFSGETGNKGWEWVHAFKASILENDD
jgi:putative DNA primase/helicase